MYSTFGFIYELLLLTCERLESTSRVSGFNGAFMFGWLWLLSFIEDLTSMLPV